MLCSSETVTDQAMPRQEALAGGTAAKWQGQGLPGPRAQQTGGAYCFLEDLQVHHYTKSDSYSILQNHVFFCHTVVWNRIPYDFSIELTNSMDDSYHYFRHIFHEKMNSYKKAWISTYQEQVKRISSMNSWYEIMFFLWIHAFVYELAPTKNR
jgi:hypothetical protein